MELLFLFLKNSRKLFRLTSSIRLYKFSFLAKNFSLSVKTLFASKRKSYYYFFSIFSSSSIQNEKQFNYCTFVCFSIVNLWFCKTFTKQITVWIETKQKKEAKTEKNHSGKMIEFILFILKLCVWIRSAVT